MQPEDLVGERVELLYAVRDEKNPDVIIIPAGALGVVTGWDGDRLDLSFEVGMQQQSVQFSFDAFVNVTVPCSAERRLT